MEKSVSGGVCADESFVRALASADPTPGGGGAAAYCGALAAALASMVGNLTVGKRSYAAVEGQVRACLERLEASRARLLQLIDQDARAFEPLAAAYRLPKETSCQLAQKEAAVQQALLGACEPPLAIMREVAALVDDIDFLAHEGSRMARSDAGVAAAFARAAIEGASLNAYVNAASMVDESRAQAVRAQADELLERTVPRCTELFEFVRREVS